MKGFFNYPLRVLFKLFLAGIIAAAAVFLFLAGLGALDKDNQTPWKEVEATITGTEIIRHIKAGSCVYVTVHFEYENIKTLDTMPVDAQFKPWRNCSSAKWVTESIRSQYPAGKKLIVRVNPRDLKEVLPQKRSKKVPYVFIALGVLLFLLSIYIVFIPVKKPQSNN